MTERFVDFELTSGLILTLLIFASGALILFSVAVSTMLQNLSRATATQPTDVALDDKPVAVQQSNPALGYERPFANSATKRPPTILVTVALVGLGGGLMLYGGYAAFSNTTLLRTASDSKDWPSVLGYIQSVETKREDNGYRAAVTYAYEVENNAYLSDRISFRTEEPVFYTGDLYQRFLNENGFIPNRRVRVYYDPSAPESAVILREHNVSVQAIIFGLIEIVVGAVMIGFGITNAVDVWRDRRQRMAVRRQEMAPAS